MARVPDPVTAIKVTVAGQATVEAAAVDFSAACSVASSAALPEATCTTASATAIQAKIQSPDRECPAKAAMSRLPMTVGVPGEISGPPAPAVVRISAAATVA